MTSSPFQFRLSTLFFVTTILCLLFAVAAVNLPLALIAGSFSFSIASIVLARHFGESPAVAGAWSIIGTPVGTGCLYLTVATVRYFTHREVEESYYTSFEFVVLIAAYCALLGLIPGIVTAVGYWVLTAVGSLIFNRWDKYFVDDEAARR